MVKVTDQNYYMDGYLQNALDTAKKAVKKDWDMVFGVDGGEGAGKSVHTQQMAYYCDSTLNLDRIVFNPEDFKKAVLNAEKYQAIVLDEAYGSLSSRGSMSRINKVLVQMLTVIREKNLFIFIVLPSFFDLDKYVALWRSRALIHVYTANTFERGYFAFYNKDRKKDLYVNGKKFYNYRVAKPNFVGRFTNYYVVDEAEYRKKKQKTSMSIEDDNKPKKDTRFFYALKALSIDNTQREIAKKLTDVGLQISQGRVNQLIHEYDEYIKSNKHI